MLADIVLIIVMLLCIFLGYKKGLIRVATRILGFVIALVIALILYTPISNYIIENTEIVPNLKETIQANLYNDENEVQSEESKNIIESMQNFISKETDSIKANTAESVSQSIAIVIVRIGTWIVLFVTIKILTIFIRFLGDAIGNIPIIKQFNKLRWNNIWYS